MSDNYGISQVNIKLDEKVINFCKNIRNDLLFTNNYLKSDIQVRQNMVRDYIANSNFTLVSTENRRKGSTIDKPEYFALGLSIAVPINILVNLIDSNSDPWVKFLDKFNIEKVPTYYPGKAYKCQCGQSCGYVHRCTYFDIETGKTYTFEIGSDCAQKHKIISEEEFKECKKNQKGAKKKYKKQESEKKVKQLLQKHPNCIRCPGISSNGMDLAKKILGKRDFEKLKEDNYCTNIIDKENDNETCQCDECYEKELKICYKYLDNNPKSIKHINSLYRYESEGIYNHPLFIRNWDVLKVKIGDYGKLHYIIRGTLHNEILSDDDEYDKIIFIYSGTGELKKYIDKQANDGGLNKETSDCIGIMGNEIKLQGWNEFVNRSSGRQIKYVNLSVC